MKLTRSQLKNIVREELASLVSPDGTIQGDPKGKKKKKKDESVNERVSMPFANHLFTAMKELDFMIGEGPADDAYDKPKKSFKIIKIARKLLDKVK